MNKTKIDWADFSWNPVWGCRNHCPYCYARRIAQRFGKTEEEKAFKPMWKQRNFEKTFPKKPSRIFVNSMSDIAFWEDEWWDKVLAKIAWYPRHIFLFLTKKPECYEEVVGFMPENCWLGITITTQAMMDYFADLIFDTTWDDSHKIFFSIEPILEEITIHVKPDWLIIGAETGNRKGKVIPELSWIQNLVAFAVVHHTPVWLKENLHGIWPGNLIQELPMANE